MKRFIFFVVLMGFSVAMAEEHKFFYEMKDKKRGTQTFTFTSNADYPTALEQGAKACYRFFKNGERLAEERGLDIIDTCANPRKPSSL